MSTPTTPALLFGFGNAADLALADAWLRGVLQSIYGPAKWEAIYKGAGAQDVLRLWAHLPTLEA